MSERVERWVDASVGETREALVQDGRVIALHLARASDEGVRARWGEVYCARVGDVDRRRRGAFLDLGLREQQGFLPLLDDGRVRQQSGVSVAEMQWPRGTWRKACRFSAGHAS